MGGPDTRRRGQRHGQHRAHVGHAGIRPERKSALVRHPGRRTAATAAAAVADAVRHDRQRRWETDDQYNYQEEVVENDTPPPTLLVFLFHFLLTHFRSHKKYLIVYPMSWFVYII